MGDRNKNVNSPQSIVGSSGSSQSFISSDTSVNIGNTEERRDTASELEAAIAQLKQSNSEKHSELLVHMENLSELLKAEEPPSQNMLQRTVNRVKELLPTIEDMSDVYARLRKVVATLLGT